jgi:two-component system, NarL family, sensor kinase
VLGLNLAEILHSAQARDPEIARQVEAAEELVQQLHREIRTTSYLLHPPLLDETGLASAIAWYTQGLAERTDLKIDFQIADDFGRIPKDMELAMFRVVQESLTNIHRHSEATDAVIRIARCNGSLSLEVSDNGKGMPPEKLAEIQSRGTGVGIRGIRERVHQLQGDVQIESGPSGTRIRVSIPLPRSTEDNSPEPLNAVA